MDEFKKGVILDSIIKELVEKAKNRLMDDSKQKYKVDISEIIREMEVKAKNS